MPTSEDSKVALSELEAWYSKWREEMGTSEVPGCVNEAILYLKDYIEKLKESEAFNAAFESNMIYEETHD